MLSGLASYLKARQHALVAALLTVAIVTGLVRFHGPIEPAPVASSTGHKLGAFNGTTAKFKINSTASSPPGFDATPSQVITLQLETNPAPDIYQTKFSVYSPGDPNSPLASLSAPTLTLSPPTGIAATPTSAVTFTMPGSGVHTYKIRCVVNGGVEAATGKIIPQWTYERIISIRSGNGLRKQLPGESTEYNARGWTDEQNREIDAVAALAGGGSTVTIAVADLTALRAVTALTDGLAATVTSPPSAWVYSLSSGAGFADDGKTVVKPGTVLLGSNGRWYNTAPAPVVPTIAALRLAVAGKNDSISVQAYSANGDGGGDVFDYDSADTTTADDSGRVIVAGTRRYKRRVPFGVYDVVKYGAKGDGSTNDRPAIQAALTAVPTTGGSVYFPPNRTYKLDSTALSLSGKSNVKIYSDGPGATIQLVINSRGIDIYNDPNFEMSGLTWAGTLQSDGGDPLGLPGRVAPSNIAQTAIDTGQVTGGRIHHTNFVDLGGYAIFIGDHTLNLSITDDNFIRTQAGVQSVGGAVVYGGITISRCYFEGNVWQTPDIPNGKSWGSDDQIAFFNGKVSDLLVEDTVIDKQGYLEANTHKIDLVNTVNNTVRMETHGYPVGKAVRFTSTVALPSGLAAGRTYYVIAANYSTIDFSVSETAGGAAVALGTTGSGLIIVQGVNDGSSNQAAAIDIVLDAPANSSSHMQNVTLRNVTIKNVRSSRTSSQPAAALRQDSVRPAIQILGDASGNTLKNLKLDGVTVLESNMAATIAGPGMSEVSISRYKAENIYGLAGTHAFVEEDGLNIGSAGAISRVALDDIKIIGPAFIGIVPNNITGLAISHAYVQGQTTYSKTATADNSTDAYTAANHNFLPNDVLQATTSGSLPTGLSLATNYYVVQDTLTALQFKDQFKVSASINGSPVNITTNGTGTLTWTRRLNDLGGGSIGINASACANMTIADSFVDGMLGAAYRTVACSRTDIHDTVATNNSAYIQLLVSGNGKVHNNDQSGNTSSTLTETTGGVWQKYNNTISGGTADRADFTGTAQFSSLNVNNGTVFTDANGKLQTAAAAGDWTGSPGANVVAQLTGVANSVAIPAATKLAWAASGPSIEDSSTEMIFRVNSAGQPFHFYDTSNEIARLQYNSGNELFRIGAGASTFTLVQDLGTSQSLIIRNGGTTPAGLFLDGDDVYTRTSSTSAKGRWNNTGLRVGDGAASRQTLDVGGRIAFTSGQADPGAVGYANTFVDGANHLVFHDSSNNHEPISSIIQRAPDLTDANQTITISGGSLYTLQTGVLTTTRNKTLGTSGASAGIRLRVRRWDTSANTVPVINGGAGAGTIFTFQASQSIEADFKYDGTNWALDGYWVIQFAAMPAAANDNARPWSLQHRGGFAQHARDDVFGWAVGFE